MYYCLRKDCPNKGEYYCEDCTAGDNSRHDHAANRIVYLTTEEAKKWKILRTLV